MRLAFQHGHHVPAFNPALLPHLGAISATADFFYYVPGADTGTGDESQDATHSLAAGIIGGGFTGASVALSSGSAVAGGIAGALTLAAGIAASTVAGAVAAPFLLAAAALVGPIASMFKGCGSTCTQATQIANAAEVALTQVRDHYLSLPIHYDIAQRGALAAFDAIANQMYKACSNPALGPAGQRCISERLVHGSSAPWCPTGSGCDWITTIRDPIANDPHVVPTPMGQSVDPSSGALVPVGTPGSIPVNTPGAVTLNTSGLGIPLPILLGGGLLLALAVLNK